MPHTNELRLQHAKASRLGHGKYNTACSPRPMSSERIIDRQGHRGSAAFRRLIDPQELSFIPPYLALNSSVVTRKLRRLASPSRVLEDQGVGQLGHRRRIRGGMNHLAAWLRYERDVDDAKRTPLHGKRFNLTTLRRAVPQADSATVPEHP